MTLSPKVELALKYLSRYSAVVWVSPVVAVLGEERVEDILRYTAVAHGLRQCTLWLQENSILSEQGARLALTYTGLDKLIKQK
jgi:hypothetical protein